VAIARLRLPDARAGDMFSRPALVLYGGSP